MNSLANNKEIQKQVQDKHHYYQRSTDKIDSFAGMASR